MILNKTGTGYNDNTPLRGWVYSTLLKVPQYLENMEKSPLSVFGYVYKITNLINGKIYFGITRNSVEVRWKQHCETKKKSYLHRSIDKYGEKAFVIKLIKTCYSSYQLYESEKFFIKKFDSTNRAVGYNNSTGGEASSKGVKHTKETRLKQSLRQRGNKQSQETIKKRIDKNTGQKRTEEYKSRMSVYHKANPNYAGKKNKGKVRTKEHKKRISDTLKARTDNKGELHNMAKLTNALVLEIRSKYIPRKYSSRKLAKEYGISKTNVLDILHKRIWKNI